MSRGCRRCEAPGHEAIGSRQNFIDDYFIQEDEQRDGDDPLKKNGSYGRWSEQFEPVLRIIGIALPEPPSQHGQKLEGKEDDDQNVKPFSDFDFVLRIGNDIQVEVFWADFEDGERKEKSTHHQAQAQDPVLVVEESHADGRRKA